MLREKLGLSEKEWIAVRSRSYEFLQTLTPGIKRGMRRLAFVEMFAKNKLNYIGRPVRVTSDGQVNEI